MKQRILFVSRNLPPLIGGIERLSTRLHNGLSEHYEVTVIGPSGCRPHLLNGQKIIELPQNPIVFVVLSIPIAIYLSLHKRFNACIGANGLVAPVCYVLKRVFKTPSLVLVHGLDLTTSNSIYQRIFLPTIRRATCVIANSRPTRLIAIEKKIPENLILVVNPGVDIPPSKTETTQQSGSQSADASSQRNLLFVGRIVKRKGLSKFISHCLPAIIRAYPKCRLVVVGDTPEDAIIKDPEELRDVNEAVARYRLEKYIHFMGRVSDDELQAAYQSSDILILPLTPVTGDIEGFGMVALEAAACGVPTIAFSIGGITDAVLDGKTGLLIKSGDYAAYTSGVLAVLGNTPQFREQCLKHAKANTWEQYVSQIIAKIESQTYSRHPA